MKQAFDAIKNSATGSIPLDQVQFILNQKFDGLTERVNYVKNALDNYSKQDNTPAVKKFYEDQLRSQVNALELAMNAPLEKSKEESVNYKFLTKAFRDYIEENYGQILDSANHCFGKKQLTNILNQFISNKNVFLSHLNTLNIPWNFDQSVLNAITIGLYSLYSMTKTKFEDFPLTQIEKFTDLKGVDDISTFIKETNEFIKTFLSEASKNIKSTKAIREGNRNQIEYSDKANASYMLEFSRLSSDNEFTMQMYETANEALLTKKFINKLESLNLSSTLQPHIEKDLCELLERKDNRFCIRLDINASQFNTLETLEALSTKYPKLHTAVCDYITNLQLSVNPDFDYNLTLDFPSYFGYLSSNANTRIKQFLFTTLLLPYSEIITLQTNHNYTKEQTSLISILAAKMISNLQLNSANKNTAFIHLLTKFKKSSDYMILCSEEATKLLEFAPNYFDTISTLSTTSIKALLIHCDLLITAFGNNIPFNEIHQIYSYSDSMQHFEKNVLYAIQSQRVSCNICLPIQNIDNNLLIEKGVCGKIDADAMHRLLKDPRVFQYINFAYKTQDNYSLFTAAIKCFGDDVSKKCELIQMVAKQFIDVKSFRVLTSHHEQLAEYLIAAKAIGADTLDDAVRKLTFNKATMNIIKSLSDTEIRDLFSKDVIHLYKAGQTFDAIKSAYTQNHFNISETIKSFAENKKRTHTFFNDDGNIEKVRRIEVFRN